MRHMSRFFHSALTLSLFLVLAGVATTGQAPSQAPTSAPTSVPQRMTIQATAMGTSTQMGRMFNVNLHIEQFSTPEERQALIEAFARSGHEGLVDALTKLKPKGRISTPWGVGNEVKYIFELPSEKGRHLRLVTDRRISIREARNAPRSEQYSIAAVDLFLTPDGKGTGTLLPACKLTVNKKKQQIEVESFQNEWKLTNFIISNK